MTFIKSLPDEQATADVEKMYHQYIESHGYVPNFARLFSHRPEVLAAWRNLVASIRKNMDHRRYELVTIAAANALHSSYCMLAHGSVLRKQFYQPDQLEMIVKDFHNAELEAAEIAMMDFTQKVVRDATSITEVDIEALRRHGFSDPEIFDITVTATARCFFSKTLDALGALPDRIYMNLEEDLREALTVGRPISEETIA